MYLHTNRSAPSRRPNLISPYCISLHKLTETGRGMPIVLRGGGCALSLLYFFLPWSGCTNSKSSKHASSRRIRPTTTTLLHLLNINDEMLPSSNNRAKNNSLAGTRASLSPWASVGLDKKDLSSEASGARSAGALVQKHTCDDAVCASDGVNVKDFTGIDEITSTSKASFLPVKDETHDTEEYINRWEEEALSHFRNSDWKEVVLACKNVLSVPGQVQTNFDVLYEIGYAHMRLGEYEPAAKYFMCAHRIDSNRVSLRLVMRDLRRKMTTGPWKKRSASEVSGEKQPGSKKTYSPQASPKRTDAVQSSQDGGNRDNAPGDDQSGLKTVSTPQA